jgi:hypothetical protein
MPLSRRLLTLSATRCLQAVMPEPMLLRFLIILREVLLPPFSFPFHAHACSSSNVRIGRSGYPSSAVEPHLPYAPKPAILLRRCSLHCALSREQPVQRAVSHFSMLNVLAGRGEAWAQVLLP